MIIDIGFNSLQVGYKHQKNFQEKPLLQEVSIPYRLATNKSWLIVNTIPIVGFNSLQVGYKQDIETPRTEYFVEVSIPYRLATNKFEKFKIFQILLFQFLIGWLQTNYSRNTRGIGVSFNSLQVGYKPRTIMLNGKPFLTVSIPYRLATNLMSHRL